MSESAGKIIREYAIAVILAVLLALLIRSLLIEAYRIPSSAMRPTLEAGDTIFAAKWPFGLRLPGFSSSITQGRMPNRGEVTIFSNPVENRDYVRRIIGLPGDTVQVTNGKIILNQKPLQLTNLDAQGCGEETLPGGLRHGVCFENAAGADFGPKKIPADSVFVIGDLRVALKGATNWDIVPLSGLRGSALWVWLSFGPSPKEPGEDPKPGSSPKIRFERMFRRIN